MKNVSCHNEALLKGRKPIHQTSVIKVIGPLLAFSEFSPQKIDQDLEKYQPERAILRKLDGKCLTVNVSYIDTKLSFVILRSLSASMLMCPSVVKTGNK